MCWPKGRSIGQKKAIVAMARPARARASIRPSHVSSSGQNPRLVSWSRAPVRDVVAILLQHTPRGDPNRNRRVERVAFYRTTDIAATLSDQHQAGRRRCRAILGRNRRAFGGIALTLTLSPRGEG